MQNLSHFLRQVLTLTVSLFAILGMGHQLARACTCSNGDPIRQFDSTPIVFIGTVTSIKEDKTTIQRFGRERVVRTRLVAYINVDEALKGISGKKATIITGGGEGDCGFSFEAGKKYLVAGYPLTGASGKGRIISATVFGNPNPSRPITVGRALFTSICSLTNTTNASLDEIDIIRDYIAKKPQSRIYGVINNYVYDFDGGVMPQYLGPLSKIKVIAEGDGRSYETETDQSGRFRIKSIVPGKYLVRLLIPDRYTTLWPWDKFEIAVEIKSQKDTEYIDLDTQPSSSVSGVVKDSNGDPVSDQVELSLIHFETIAQLNLDKHSRSQYTKTGGGFVFEGVKPGKYILGVSIVEAPAKNTPYSKTYFPSGTDPSKASVIEVTEGKKVGNIDFRMQSKLETFSVEGTVLSKDGKPVIGAEIEIFDSETPTKQVFGFSDDIKSDLKGHFKITGFKDRSYLLHAWKDTDYFAGAGVQSEQVPVIFDKAIGNVQLVLNKDGIFVSQLKK